MRHGYEPASGVSISSLAYEYPAAWQIPEHSHRSDQRQVRLIKAVELLTTGTSIKAAAATVGYRQASTFIAVFSRQFGLTPRAWIAVNSPKLIEIKRV